MRTKTGELLMQKLKNRPASPVPVSSDPPRIDPTSEKEPIRQPKRQVGLHSRVNEYKFVSITNRREGSAPSKDDFKSLEIQNLRLIEENMRLTEWTHDLLNRLRQGIMRGIQAIEEFRYLEGVNLMYHFLGEMTEHEDSEFKLPGRSELVEESQILKKYANPLPKNGTSSHFSKLELESWVNRITIEPSEGARQPVKDSRESFGADRSGGPGLRPGEEDENYLRMLMIQSLGVESLMDKHVWYS